MSDLNTAPPHIKLAVDLIMLLEQNDVAAATVLEALPIVAEDFKRKLEEEQKE